MAKPKLDLKISSRYGERETRLGSSKRFSTDSFILNSNAKSNFSGNKSRISLGKY